MIDVIDLKKHFGEFQALKGITTTIHEGEKVAVIGPPEVGRVHSYVVSIVLRTLPVVILSLTV